MQKIREKALVVCKIGLAGSLIYWLIATGKLDLRGLGAYGEHGGRLAWATLGFWSCGAVVLCAMRWHALVWGLGSRLSRLQAVRLNLIGLFFNTIMPGMVGGDLIKALYLSKHDRGRSKTAILFSAFLDRAIGLAALFLISLGGLMANWAEVAAHPVLLPLVYLVLAMVGAGTLAAALLLYPMPVLSRHPTYQALRAKLLAMAVIGSLLQALQAYRQHPRGLLVAMAYALAHQALFVLLFLAVTASIVPGPLPIGLLLTILPLAMVTTAIPLAPGGLGVGHVAFEKLFHMIGLNDGANVFNIITLGLLALNMLGAIAYIFNKAEVKEVLQHADLQADGLPVQQRCP